MGEHGDVRNGDGKTCEWENKRVGEHWDGWESRKMGLYISQEVCRLFHIMCSAAR